MNKDVLVYKVPLAQAQQARELVEAEMAGNVPCSFVRLAQFFTKPQGKLLTREQATAEWNKLPDGGPGSRDTDYDRKRQLTKCEFCKEDPPDHVGAQCPTRRGTKLRQRPPLHVADWVQVCKMQKQRWMVRV